MTKKDKYPDTAWFHWYNANPKNRITGDCAIRAICTVLEKPWEDVVRELAELSIKNGYSVASKENIDRYMKLNGWVKQKQPRKANNTKYTGVEFCERVQDWVFDEDLHGANCGDGIIIAPRILAKIGGHHVVAVINGKVWDTWNSTDGCIGNYWTKV